MNNKYEIRGDVTAIKIVSRKYGTFETLISTSKLDLVSDYVDHWFIQFNNRNKSFYVSGKSKHDNYKKQVSIHRLIMGFPVRKIVDHINHDTLDNRDSNLRLVSNLQNQQNRKDATRNSSSGVRNVHWHKAYGKWEVQIKMNQKKITIGYFTDIKEAEKAAIEARRKFMPFSENDRAV
ncbi:HNH endonuclease [Paenibacillus sp. GYB003]|uniref:HNH endonuclease n=1 Tax=Paenibacillus sp. GYB003 TaxID=2994392 RepID=UPI002F966EC8